MVSLSSDIKRTNFSNTITVGLAYFKTHNQTDFENRFPHKTAVFTVLG